MAFISWGDDDEEKKDELGFTPIKQVASVQSGAWQPAPSGADAPQMLGEDDEQKPAPGIFDQTQNQQENYLLSDEKAQVDQEKAQRDAEIAEARRQDAARQAAAAQMQQQQEEEPEYDLNAAEKDTGWKKYYDKEFKREKDGLDFWGRLMDGGQSSKRAEVAARNKYNSELLMQAYDDDGNVLDANAAAKAKVLSHYNSAVAQQNSERSRALGNAIGAFDKPGQDGGFWGRVKNAINAEKQMSIYDSIFGADDTTKFSINDVGRFGGGLIQGIGTMPVIGGKELTESVRGRGTNYETGLEEDLNGLERGGRLVSGGLNVVTPFVGGSGKLLDSLTSKVLKDTATTAEKTLLKKLTSQVAMPALEQGAIGATQAGAEYFGNGNTLLDENGEFDKDKLLQFAKETGTAGAMGVAGGALLSGGAMGVTRLRNRGDVTPLTRDEILDMETRNTNSAEAQVSQNRSMNEQPDLQALENAPAPQERVADGIATPDAPDAPITAEAAPVDSNVEFTPANVADGVPVDATPVASANIDMARAGEVTPDMLPADAPVADGVVDAIPTEVTPVRDPVVEAPADATPVATPKTPAPADVAPVADGVVSSNVPPVRDDLTPVGADEVRALQESRVGKNQADEAAINQQLREAGAATPKIDEPTDSLPEGIAPVKAENLPEMDIPGDGTIGSKEFAERFMPKLASAKETKKDIANAVDMGKDVESSVREILAGGNVKPKKAERIAKQYDKFDKQLQEYNRLTEENQKAYAENGVDGISEETSRANRRAGRELGITMRRLQQEIKRLDISGDRKEAFFNGLTNMLGSRNASVLTSAGLIERNMFQEATANAKLALKNPIKMTKSTFGQGNILKDTAKAELSHWGDVPRTATEVVKYVVGNTYRTAMIPTTALANTRRGAVRQEFTRWAYDALQGGELSAKDAKKLSGTAGNEMEALVNTFTGVDNGMTNRGQAMDAMNAWKEYMKTGDDAAKDAYLKNVEQHSSLASQMISGMAAKDQTKFRALKAMGDLIFPFVRTAKNLAVNTVQQDLNPMARSLIDEIRVDQRSGGANAINLIKSKLVDYGIMGGAAALASSGMIQYNDGDQVDKPKGWSIKIGDNEYIPVRATSLELPIAMAGAAQTMFNDINEGKARDWKYYAGMITGSLPYIDQFNTTSGAVDSMVNGEDAGYAAKAYAVNTAKGFVPFSNNGIQAYAAGKAGESLNAKTVYDDDLMTWFTNTVRKSYDPDFYNSLKDSRDNAGRVRTVDNQGVISNKTMNDEGTREFNDRITDLVDYGRENGLGENTKDMFNSYDTGKNNNFKSIQDAITFLDAEDGKPDNTKKLEKNAKYTDLAQQIRDGFFGESGDELLTLDGKNLYSDVSVPNGAGSKNTRLPMNMQSIKNAIAQTDLPEDQRDRIKELGDTDSALYARLKSKEITYEQYSAEKAKTGQEYIDILSNSENYKKMESLFDELDESGFFEEGGLGSTRSGQTYLWNSLNALLGSKGATPAANFPDTSKGFTPWGNRGTGRSSNAGAKNEGMEGLRWSPVGKRQMAAVQSGRYTPVNVKVKLGNAIKKDRSQNYSDRSF